MSLSFPCVHSQLAKRKANTFPTSWLAALSRWPYGASGFLPALPKAPIQKLSCNPAFTMLARTYKPNAQIRNFMPESCGHIRSHSEQRKQCSEPSGGPTGMAGIMPRRQDGTGPLSVVLGRSNHAGDCRARLDRRAPHTRPSLV